MPTFAAESYYHNGLMEREIAGIVSNVSGTSYCDIVNYARPEYDWQQYGEFVSDYDVPFSGSAQIEFKSTTKSTIPVELYKDDAETIPSGLGTSTAPFVITLSMSPSNDVAKLRAFKRQVLLRSVGLGVRHFFPGKTPSQGSVQYQIPCTNETPSHLWLGDFRFVQEIDGRLAINSDFFVPGYGGEKFRDWIKEYVAKQQQVEMF